jgi:hypothetical protein
MSAALQDVPLADRLWTQQQVADYLHYKPRTLERVSKLPGFPLPARPGNPKVWRAGDIIAWVRANSERMDDKTIDMFANSERSDTVELRDTMP